MKKILLISLCLIFICGCNSTADTLSMVEINLPKDNSVNGYRNNENSGGISWDDIQIIDDIPSDLNFGSNDNSSSNDNTDTEYCGNKNSKKFHKSTCSALKKTKDENKVFYNSRSEYIENGFNPCGICNP